MFLDISLGYVDECCLGYTFYHPAQNPYKSAADGVIIYFQNVEDVAQGCGEDNGDGHLIVRGGYVDCVYPLRWIVSACSAGAVSWLSLFHCCSPIQ